MLSINLLKNKLELFKNDIFIQEFNKNFKIENISYSKFFTDARKNIIIGAMISGVFLISGHIVNNYFGKVVWN